MGLVRIGRKGASYEPSGCRCLVAITRKRRGASEDCWAQEVAWAREMLQVKNQIVRGYARSRAEEPGACLTFSKYPKLWRSRFLARKIMVLTAGSRRLSVLAISE